MRLVPGAVVFLALACSPALAVSAQQYATGPAAARQGLWYGAGLGIGDGNLYCNPCASHIFKTGGTAGYFRIGGTVRPTFLLGAELNVWRRGEDDGSRRIIALTGNAYWYPKIKHGWYLKGGAGFTDYRKSSSNQDAITSRAFALHMGTGYEVRVNSHTSVVPFLNIIASAFGSWYNQRDETDTRTVIDQGEGNAKTFLLQIGVGITWH